MRILLLTPPMTQINTPYPATAYLTGFLKEKGYEVAQADLSLELFLRLFSSQGLSEMAQIVESQQASKKVKLPYTVQSFLLQKDVYARRIEPVLRFLQHQDSTLAHRIVSSDFLPRGPRFSILDEMDDGSDDNLAWAFGQMGTQDRAQFLASLFIDDVADFIRDAIDPRFELSKYAEKLAASAASFEPILNSLQSDPTYVDYCLDELTTSLLERYSPDFIGLTVPFPGNVYGAFRIAARVKQQRPQVRIALGGGYANTELRTMSDARVFDFIDYITLDDGERPLLSILESLKAGLSGPLLRTLVREGNHVVQRSDNSLHDIPFRDAGVPTYEGLRLKEYPSLCEMLNPMHRLWSDGRWNKITLAHGCYWKKCSFCDTTLDYISRYEPQSATGVVDRMQKLIAETGETGFHLVDEAAPPKLLSAMSKEILERDLSVSWWGNIRFEKTFTPDLVELMAQAGCVAMSGGLEVASDRLLKLMEKGVTVDQVARVTHAFTQQGILVHAYLMYGFPSQTVAETVDALEYVRQLFANGCIQSAFWHRFSVTAHSPVGKNPDKYGIKLLQVRSTFAVNDIAFEDSSGVDHDTLYPGLKKALYNYMLGVGLEEDVRSWFDIPVPKTTVAKNFVASALRSEKPRHLKLQV
jgi:radical SAM superfamily enzyme YgiQ (UPF0313 family)